ncbi:hypothetical protein FB45DRAFT_1009047 [Roridomyces roridus]|uniref:F-box domain-containing protein n=1 Tax=Roridomyces roridus TaxID=1738132 RepID=A0AAD7B883_9AGAR|nr:hypothetical protein FB45DRAFT_1009047 [Roridomyces roridus]
MSSVDELRRRITSLEEAIEREQERPRDLERQRSSTQSELNSLIDPMARLPPEISSDILLQSIPTPPTWGSLITFLLVCRAWADLALATPLMWSKITDMSVPWDKLVRVLEIWLDRAGDVPIPLTFGHILLYTFHHIVRTLEAHVPQVQSLSFSALHNNDLALLTYSFDGLT